MAAPTRVGGNSTTYASRTNTTVTVSGYTILADDIILVNAITAASSEAPDASLSLYTPIGTALDTSDDGFNLEARMFYKRAAGGETSVAITHSSCSSQGVVEVWRGVDWSTGPLDATQTQAHGAGTTATATGLTTVTADAKLLFFGSDWADTTNNLSPPSGMTEHLDNTLSYVASETIAAPGATGNRAHTVNNVGAFHRWTARLIALRPAPDASGSLLYMPQQQLLMPHLVR